MMIVDLHQVMISNLMQQMGAHTNMELDENLLRHFILNSLRSYNTKFRAKYGEMVIACDDKFSWRKQVFPYYKANRKKDRDSSDLDWNAIFGILNKIREELKVYFPYRVIHVERAEADDVIGSLAFHFGNTSQKILIISGDKDFRQLQSFLNVDQYDPVRKKMMVENNPTLYLQEHIMRGDRGDGVPNFLSKDDSLVTNTRQKPLAQKKLDMWLYKKPEEFCDEDMLRGYRRNEQLVDLSFTPKEISSMVVTQFNEQSSKGRGKLFDYFIQFKLKNLMTDLDHF